MKIKDGFVLNTIADSYVVVPVHDTLSEFSSIIKLSETGAFLWRCLENDTDEEKLLSALTDEYDVSEDRAKEDIRNFITKLKEANLLDF